METPVHTLPDVALNSHVAIVGKTGSGKTYRAKWHVEALLRAKKRAVILDPTDAWWGLRSSADGKGPGLPITVFGGDHADVEITEHAGAALGELLGSKPISAIVSLAGMGTSAMHRFAAAFFESLYRTNKAPITLFIDEADEFAPQTGAPGTERMLGAVDRIVRRGRSRGFRVWMISQRPAVLNKNVLTQANTLIAMRLPASQDRKAIEAWIKGQADESQAKELLGSLAGLKRGEGWTWCPEAGLLERGTTPTLSTFDSSRSPEDGDAGPARVVLADVDLAGVKAALSAAIEEAKANDPAVLKAEIARLKTELAKKGVGAGDAKVIADLRAELDFAHARTAEHDRDHETERDTLKQLLSGVNVAVTEVREAVCKVWDAIQDPWDAGIDGAVQENGKAARAQSRPVGERPTSAPREPARSITTRTDDRQNVEAPHSDLPGPARRVLDALAWWHAAGVEAPTRRQVGPVSGYKPDGSSWRGALAEIRKRGLVEDIEGDRLRLTPIGHAAVHVTPVPTLADLHRAIRDQLSGLATRAFDILTQYSPVTRNVLAARLEYEAGGSSMRGLLAELRGMGLIEYGPNDTVSGTDVMFPESLEEGA